MVVFKQQIILIIAGLSLLASIYLFASTQPPKKLTANHNAPSGGSDKALHFNTILSASKQKLSAAQQSYVNKLEQSVVRGDVKAQQIAVFRQLSSFWKDSVHVFIPYAYYNAAAAKLENSEKSLTFAAQIYLDELRGLEEPAIKKWMADECKTLFQQALVLNPHNDSSAIGVGASYIFGSSAASPQDVMQGIQKILVVARKDSTNAYAQMMLGVGGVVSGQLDKAIERFNHVLRINPNNLEAMLMLAEAYERKADKANAIKWYEKGKTFIHNKKMIEALDDRVKKLK
jgi:tetratricopeptide (TPR) repeat protein